MDMMTMSATATSDGSMYDAPPSEIEQAESVGGTEPFEQRSKEEDCRSGVEETSCAEEAISSVQVEPKSFAVTAPPGIGPPGVWVWPDDAKPCDVQDADAEEQKLICWPCAPVNSVEVEFIGKVAQACFGADFKKMTVSWDEPMVQGDATMEKANVQLHLAPWHQCIWPSWRLWRGCSQALQGIRPCINA